MSVQSLGSTAPSPIPVPHSPRLLKPFPCSPRFTCFSSRAFHLTYSRPNAYHDRPSLLPCPKSKSVCHPSSLSCAVPCPCLSSSSPSRASLMFLPCLFFHTFLSQPFPSMILVDLCFPFSYYRLFCPNFSPVYPQHRLDFLH